MTHPGGLLIARTARRLRGLALASLSLLLVAVPASADLATQLVADGLVMPNLVTAPAGDTQRLFVVEQLGTIRIIKSGTLLQEPFLDIDPLVPNVTGSDERGLVGLAFHPEYDQNGYFYIAYYNIDGHSIVARYSVSSDPDVADPASAFTILDLQQPHQWHNLNTVAFGPNDGYLYIGVGDGGPSGDPHNRAQNGLSLFGKILRVDVNGSGAYSIPPDNPFVGDGTHRDEIWGKGLRNPYRFSFDAENGDLFIGDVGQDDWEEVSYQPGTSPGGLNFGWRRMEGSHCFTPQSGCDNGSLEHPVYEYDHGGTPFRCSVTGGVVYRGEAIPEIQGRYFFGDYCSARIWSLKIEGGSATDLTDHTADLAPGGGLDITWLSGLGQGARGEMYIIDREDGEIFRVVREPQIGVREATVPTAGFRLTAALPNPFSATTSFTIVLERAGSLDAEVYGPAGRRVRTLRRGQASPGTQALTWDGTDDRGRPVASGIYFLRVRTEDGAQTRRVVLTR